MSKKGYKMREEEKEKRRRGMINAYKNDLKLKEKTKRGVAIQKLDRTGKRNPNYKSGKYSKKYTCIECGKLISPGCTRCRTCSNRNRETPKSLKNTGRTHFKKGNIPWNNGTKYERRKKRKTIRGYTYILMPQHPKADIHGYVAKHRLTIEKHLNRYLGRKEIVHHINGKRDDNRLENLILFRNHSEHQKFRHYLTIGQIICPKCNKIIKLGG